MDLTLFLIVLFGLQVICFFAGKRASKSLHSEEDYFLASKEVKFFPLMMTFIATQIGGGLVLGSAQEAYQYGWAVLLYPLGACLGFLVLSSGVGRRLAQFEVSTVAQLFEVVYKSVKLKKVASLLSIVSLFMILVAQVIASQKFMVSLGVSNQVIFFLFWAMVILYTVMGGLKAVVSIDIIQALFFMVVFIAGFGVVLYSTDKPVLEMIQSGVDTSHFVFDSSKLTGWLLMPLLFMVIEQDMAQRCFAARTPGIVAKAAGWSALITMLVCLIPVFFGVIGKSSGLEMAQGSSVFMNVAQAFTNPWVAAFIGTAVLMAVISTAISLLNAVSSNVTQDFELSYLQKISNVAKSRGITACLGIAAVFFSSRFDNVVDLMIQSYELSVCCLFVPVFIALFKKEGNTLSATLAIVFGAIGFFLLRWVGVPIPREIVGVILSAVGFGIGEVVCYAAQPRSLFQS